MIKLKPLRKPRNQSFYMLMSSVLILSGIALVITADYSRSNKDLNVGVANEVGQMPWSNDGPDYIMRDNNKFVLCETNNCWEYEVVGSNIVPTDRQVELGDLKAIKAMEFQIDHQDFVLKLEANNIPILCSDEFCWYIAEGTNNIIQKETR